MSYYVKINVGLKIDLCMNYGSDYDELAKKYAQAKNETFYTPQATLATQRNLKETLNVTEKRPRLLQNVLLTSTLAKDETDTMKRIRTTGQQMWNAKRKKLDGWWYNINKFLYFMLPTWPSHDITFIHFWNTIGQNFLFATAALGRGWEYLKDFIFPHFPPSSLSFLFFLNKWSLPSWQQP